MTPKQIKSAKPEAVYALSSATEESFQLLSCAFWLREIAFQLAKMNEGDGVDWGPEAEEDDDAAL